MTKKLKAIFASLLCACVAATLGMTACGEDGVTPQIGDNGNWYIGETDTGVRAEGKQGEQGEPGEPGTPGAQGVGVKTITVNDEGVLVITLTNDEVLTLGKVVGADGKDGKDIKNVEINGEGKLVVTYNDDSTQTVGNVKGVGIQNIEIVDGKFKFTMTDGTNIDIPIPSSSHSHQFTAQVAKLDPTCTSVGYIKYRCIEPGCNAQDITIQPKLDHKFNAVPDVEIPANCIHKGLKTYICSECKTPKCEEIATTDHVYEEGFCKVCGAKQEIISLDVTAGQTQPVDIPAAITAMSGLYVIEADLGSTTLSSGRLKMKVNGKDVNSELVYSSIRSTVGEHEIYFGYIQIAEGDSKIDFTAEGEDVHAKLAFKKYEMPTLVANGTPIEVPVNLKGLDELKFNVDAALQNDISYTLKVECTADMDASSGTSTSYGRLTFWLGKNVNVNASSYSGYNVTFSAEEISQLRGAGYLGYVRVNNGTEPEIYPITITLTAA